MGNTALLVIALMAGLATLITAVASLVSSVGNARKLQVAAVKQEEVHVLVNSRLSDVLKRVEQLTETIQASGHDVPDDPSTK